MVRLILRIVFLAVPVFLFASGSFAQRPLDQDYFTAHKYPKLAVFLHSVDENHTSKVMDLIQKRSMSYALEELKYTLDTFPNHPWALHLAGYVARLLNQPSIAILLYDKALALYPQYALTHAQYGIYLSDIGRLAEGIKALKKALEIEPDLAIAYDGLARAYAKVGDSNLAREAVEKAKEIRAKTLK